MLSQNPQSMPYRLSRQAAQDLEDILFEGFLNFGEYQAMRYSTSLHRTFDLLADMPMIGRRSERGHENERRFVHNTHVIYYRIADDGIIIQTLIYGPLIQDIWGKD